MSIITIGMQAQHVFVIETVDGTKNEHPVENFRKASFISKGTSQDYMVIKNIDGNNHEYLVNDIKDIQIQKSYRGYINGHEYIDLGIRKSMYDKNIIPGSSDDRRIVFATCNIGADSPNDLGYYFRWGELCGWKVEGVNQIEEITLSMENCTQIVPDGKNYDVETFLWKGNPYYTGTFWNWLMDTQRNVPDFQAKDNLYYNGKQIGDAATYNWGGKWMMMNLALCSKIFETKLSNYNCTQTFEANDFVTTIKYTYKRDTDEYGVFGLELENTETGSKLFLPCAARLCQDFRSTPNWGLYWTTGHVEPSSGSGRNEAYYVALSSGSITCTKGYGTGGGFSIRPIAELPLE